MYNIIICVKYQFLTRGTGNPSCRLSCSMESRLSSRTVQSVVCYIMGLCILGMVLVIPLILLRIKDAVTLDARMNC